METCESKCASSSVGSTSATIFPYTGVSLILTCLRCICVPPVLTLETLDPIAGANEDSYVSALQPQIISDDYQISGDGFGIGSTTYASLGAFSREFGIFVPGSTTTTKSVSAKLMADRCGDSTPTGFTEASATIAISRRPVSSVKLIVLTSTVYPDTAKLQVRFQLMDATTAGTVLQTGLSLRLSATLSEDATSVASIGCALPSLTTGVGSCDPMFRPRGSKPTKLFL